MTEQKPDQLEVPQKGENHPLHPEAKADEAKRRHESAKDSLAEAKRRAAEEDEIHALRSRLRGLKEGDADAEHAALKWDDVMFIEQNRLGLRHVATTQRMNKEAKEGFQGDALVMSNVRNLVPNAIVPERVRKAEERFGYQVDVAAFSKDLGADQQQIIMQKLREALLLFFENCFEYGEKAQSEPRTIRDVIASMHGGDSFLMVQNNDAAGAYDVKQYYNLGKSGRRDFSPQEILCTVSADEIIDGSRISQDEMTGRVDEKFWQRLSHAALDQVMKKLRRHREARP